MQSRPFITDRFDPDRTAIAAGLLGSANPGGSGFLHRLAGVWRPSLTGMSYGSRIAAVFGGLSSNETTPGPGALETD